MLPLPIVKYCYDVRKCVSRAPGSDPPLVANIFEPARKDADAFGTAKLYPRDQRRRAGHPRISRASDKALESRKADPNGMTIYLTRQGLMCRPGAPRAPIRGEIESETDGFRRSFPPVRIYRSPMRERVDILSRTQKTCLRLVAQGRTSKEIALETGLSPHTVNKYLERATSVLHAENRRQAAQMFIKWEENGQFDEIEYDSKPVAAPPQPAIFEPSIGDRRSVRTGQWGLWLFGFPPLGGERHELTSVEVASTIVRIAVISAGGVAVLVTIGYWLMQLFV